MFRLFLFRLWRKITRTDVLCGHCGKWLHFIGEKHNCKRKVREETIKEILSLPIFADKYNNEADKGLSMAYRAIKELLNQSPCSYLSGVTPEARESLKKPCPICRKEKE
jgi:hypothetical protein